MTVRSVLALACIGLLSAPCVAASETDIAVLLIGNSHSSKADLPKMLNALIQTGYPRNRGDSHPVSGMGASGKPRRR